MTTPRPQAGDPGARTGQGGTPFAVDYSRDRRARSTWAVFLAGPVLWLTHFMVVYLTVEAGCSTEGSGMELFDPPVPDVVTLVATGVAAVGCVVAATWGLARWRARHHEPAADDASEVSGPAPDWDGGGTLAFAGSLLSLLSLVGVLFVGLPALVLPAC